jgi:type I restriction enzyme S subunit
MPSRGSNQLAKISSELDAIRLESEHGLADVKSLNNRDAETLPARWLETTLGEICDVNPPKPSADELPDDAEVSFVPMAAIDADLGSILTPEVRVAGEVRKRFRGFREGDVLMAKITPSMENGKAAVASGLLGGYGFGTTEFHVLRPFGGVPPEYVFFFLRRRSLREEAASRMSGKAGQKRVPAGFLEGHDFPLAPPLTQAGIVSRLCGLDKARRTTVQRLAKISARLEETRAMVLVDCFDGLGESDPSGEGSGSRGGADELPTLPDRWEWVTIGGVATRLQYGTSARSDADAHTGVPNIGMGNIRAGKLDLAEVRYVALTAEERESHRLRPGDVLFNRTNSPELVGKAAVVEAIDEAVFASYLIRVKLDRERVDPSFVAHWINSPWGRAWARQVKRDAISQSNINSRKLAAMPIPLPPLAEQRSIVAEIDELLGRGEELDRRRGEEMAELDRLWEITLEAAFQGSFDGEESAPADSETAKEQLARAQAEREDELTRRRNERKKRRIAPELSPASVEGGTSGDRFDRAIANLSSDDFSFDELHSQLGVSYDQAVDLLFGRLENPNFGLRQRFDVRRGEMRLNGPSR